MQFTNKCFFSIFKKKIELCIPTFHFSIDWFLFSGRSLSASNWLKLVSVIAKNASTISINDFVHANGLNNFLPSPSVEKRVKRSYNKCWIKNSRTYKLRWKIQLTSFFHQLTMDRVLLNIFLNNFFIGWLLIVIHFFLFLRDGSIGVLTITIPSTTTPT
jgi:hypothetical protein